MARPVDRMGIGKDRAEKGVGRMQCPNCKVELLWGYPSPEAMKQAEKGKLILCGCVIKEKNYCPNCGALAFTSMVVGGWSSLEMVRRYTSSLNSEDALRAHQRASPVDRMGLK